MGDGTNFLPELTGSMSVGAAGNPTVAMMEAAFRHHGLHWRYINLEVLPADLGPAVEGARAMGFRGFNCSIPHKVSVVRHLDGLGESAAVMGAVNCVVRREGRWIGENTDGQGFLKSLRSVADPRGKSVVLLGAGGAARAIAVELGLAGVGAITVVNRTATRGLDLVGLLRDKLGVAARFGAWEGDYRVPPGTDIVINATSVGLGDATARLALDLSTLAAPMVAADVIVNPPDTRFLREARRRGCRVLDGLGMVVNQGVIAFRHWTGVDPDPAVMRRAVEEALGLRDDDFPGLI